MLIAAATSGLHPQMARFSPYLQRRS